MKKGDKAFILYDGRYIKAEVLKIFEKANIGVFSCGFTSNLFRNLKHTFPINKLTETLYGE